MKDRLRLIAEHSLTYAPHHVAEKLGYFDAADLDIVLDYASGPGGSWLADVLARDEADIARGGVWIPMMYRGHLEDLRIFAQLCDRNVQILLSRQESPDFDFTDLIGKKVLLPAAATSQWMFLAGLLGERGVDAARIQWLRDLDISTMARLWRSGFADYFLASAPLADQLLSEGHHIAADLGIVGDRVPWSVYYARPSVLEAKKEPLVRFLNALSLASHWISHNGANEVARLIGCDFSEWTQLQIERSVARMQRRHVWLPDVRVPEATLLRYQKMIAAYGLISEPMAYEQIVDRRFAEAVASGEPVLRNTNQYQPS